MIERRHLLALEDVLFRLAPGVHQIELPTACRGAVELGGDAGGEGSDGEDGGEGSAHV